MDDLLLFKKYASKRDLVVKALRDMILSGQIVPGQRVRQEELTRLLGVSATPIREAIRLLEADGLLRGEPHHGVSVVELSADELQDLCRIRSMLEGLATRQAVDRSDPLIYESSVQYLESLQSQMEECVNTQTWGKIANLNRDFHLHIYGLSRSYYLMDMIRRLWMHLPGYLVWNDPELASASVEQHKPILDALRVRHAEAASQALQVHIDLSAIGLMKKIRDRETGKSARGSRRKVAAGVDKRPPSKDVLEGAIH